MRRKPERELVSSFVLNRLVVDSSDATATRLEFGLSVDALGTAGIRSRVSDLKKPSRKSSETHLVSITRVWDAAGCQSGRTELVGRFFLSAPKD